MHRDLRRDGVGAAMRSRRSPGGRGAVTDTNEAFKYDLPRVSEPAPARLQVVVRATHDPRPLVATVRHLGSTYKTE